VVVSAAISALPTVGGPMQTIFDAIEERQRFRAESTTREIFEIAGEDIVVQRSQEDPELQALLGNTIEAAMRTGMEAKRKLLARAAAAAFQNDERIDPATLIVSALSQLEPVHIRALARLAKVEQGAAMKAASDSEPVPVRAALIQTGVAIPSTMVFGGAVQIADVSEFGRHLLQELREAAEEDNERLALDPQWGC
jgi:hypothetical protein